MRAELSHGSGLCELPSGAAALRRRSSWFYVANEMLGRVVDLGADKLDLHSVVNCFSRWHEGYVLGKFVRLVKIDEPSEYLFIRMYNRFEDAYRKKLWRHLWLLGKCKWDLLLTLTVDPKRYFNLKQEWYDVPRCWNRVRSALQKRFGAFGYFRILEGSKKARPHLHVLVCGISRVGADWLRRVWRLGFVKVSSVFAGFDALKYLVKYVKKSIVGGSSNEFAACLFASNKRLWGMSQNIRLNLIPLSRVIQTDGLEKSKPQVKLPKWRYDGVVLAATLAFYVLKIEDFVWVSTHGHENENNFMVELFGICIK